MSANRDISHYFSPSSTLRSTLLPLLRLALRNPSTRSSIDPPLCIMRFELISQPGGILIDISRSMSRDSDCSTISSFFVLPLVSTGYHDNSIPTRRGVKARKKGREKERNWKTGWTEMGEPRSDPSIPSMNRKGKSYL